MTRTASSRWVKPSAALGRGMSPAASPPWRGGSSTAVAGATLVVVPTRTPVAVRCSPRATGVSVGGVGGSSAGDRVRIFATNSDPKHPLEVDRPSRPASAGAPRRKSAHQGRPFHAPDLHAAGSASPRRARRRLLHETTDATCSTRDRVVAPDRPQTTGRRAPVPPWARLIGALGSRNSRRGVPRPWSRGPAGGRQEREKSGHVRLKVHVAVTRSPSQRRASPPRTTSMRSWERSRNARPSSSARSCSSIVVTDAMVLWEHHLKRWTFPRRCW
jgi:hypothetical protein